MGLHSKLDPQDPSRLCSQLLFGGHLETVEILLNAGANINSKDSYGATAAMAIVEEIDKTSLPQQFKRRGTKMLSLLCDRGTDASL